MSVYKRCTCRGDDGRRLGKACPRLRNGKHGAWYYATEVRTAGGGRRQQRRGGYTSREDAQAAQDKVKARVKAGVVVDDRQTVADWLDQWLTGRRNLRPSTRHAYTAHIERYLKPHLGWVPLEQLRTGQVEAMFARIREDSPQTGAATLQRIRATLRSALSAAVRQQRVPVNVAKLIELDPGGPPRAVVWTDERVQAWQAGGARPKVAVWTPAQTGAFLDAVQGDRLYGLWHAMVFTGVRRGEAAGVRWVDVDLDQGQWTVTEQLVQVAREIHPGAPKSGAGERVIPLDTGTVTVLRSWRAAQNADRLAWGAGWVPSGRVFTKENGDALSPEYISSRFKRLVRNAGLPPIRLHDLRHGAATITLAGGADMLTVSRRLGHSTIALTANTYSAVLPEVARAAAENAAALVPRRGTVEA